MKAKCMGLQLAVFGTLARLDGPILMNVGLNSQVER
jgi:hypothetical protein